MMLMSWHKRQVENELAGSVKGQITLSSPDGKVEVAPEQVAGSRECGRIAVRTRYMLWNLSKGSRDQEVTPHCSRRKRMDEMIRRGVIKQLTEFTYGLESMG